MSDGNDFVSINMRRRKETEDGGSLRLMLETHPPLLQPHAADTHTLQGEAALLTLTVSSSLLRSDTQCAAADPFF